MRTHQGCLKVLVRAPGEGRSRPQGELRAYALVILSGTVAPTSVKATPVG